MTSVSAIAPKNASRNYPLLLASQFLSAFADNFILMVILGPLMTSFRQGAITATDQSVANIFYSCLLFIPYVILGPLSGYLNDRFSKTHWLVGGNVIKLVGSIVAACSASGGATWLMVGYLLVGVGACIYSPAKYGILPEILPDEKLVKANGMVEALTLVAILLGVVVGSAASDDWSIGVCYEVCIAIYAVSSALNLFMTRTPSYPDVRWSRSAQEFMQNLWGLVSQKRLARMLCGTALFWICGAMIKMNSQPWGQQVLHLQTMKQIGLLSVWLALGIIVGSILSGRLYKVGDVHHTRRYGFLLAAGLAILANVGRFPNPLPIAIACLIAAGFFAGLFLIPLNAAIQAESHCAKLGKTIATQNLFENTAMLCGGAVAYLNVKHGANPSQIFLSLAILVALASIWLKIPEKPS